MSATLSQGLITISASATLTSAESSYSPAFKITKSFSSGIIAGTYDKVYVQRRTIVASGTPLDIDLTSLVWTGDDSASAAAKIRAIAVKHAVAAQKITIGGGSNPFTAWMGGTTPTMDVDGNSMLLRTNEAAGWTVDSTHKVLRFVTDSATAHVFDLFIAALSA
jgi:hypothetical protein